MVFFDTCIWLELCCATNPTGATQIAQAQKAAQLLSDIQSNGDQIVTCREQLLELINAVQKVKMREYNKTSATKVGKMKEYRQTGDFANTQLLCKQVVSDVCSMADETLLSKTGLEEILNSIHLVDINDFLYYQYCVNKGIDFYTFDKDFLNLATASQIHVI